jgi:hypothetical protein
MHQERMHPQGMQQERMHPVGYALFQAGAGARGDLEAEGAAEALRQNTSSISRCYRLAMQHLERELQHLERELQHLHLERVQHQCTCI